MTKNLSKEEFQKLLKGYEEAYYGGTSTISDEEYDALKDKYIELYGEYDFVPNEGDTGFKRVKHRYPLKSLSKKQLDDKEGILELLEKLWPVIIQPKFDGLSIGIDKGCTTRGNGEEGDDVTAQCLRINGVQSLINYHEPLRAEILMTHTAFKQLNIEREAEGLELYSNCRNAASGMLRNLDLDKVKGLTVMVYEQLGSTKAETEDLKAIRDALEDKIQDTDVFITPYYIPATIDDAIEYLDKLEEFRETIDYDIDGWVIKSNQPDSLNKFGGMTDHHPKNAFAVKGKAKGAWTQIHSVTWQVGKNVITPVAELEPVEIDGSIISRCTLHNISIMEALGLNTIYCDNYHKTFVHVVKANDVIPKIIDIKHEITEGQDELNGYIDTSVNPPALCPICRQKTAIRKTDSDSKVLICTNPNCEAKLQAKIEHMAKRDAFDIKGLSEGTIAKILDTYVIMNPAEVLTITKEEILELEGFADKSATQLAKAIEECVASQPLDKVLYAAAIPLIGKTASRDICRKYTVEELNHILELNKEDAIIELCKVKGIGRIAAESLYDNRKQYELISVAISRVTDVAVKEFSNIKQETFCITGPREPFRTIIETSGHKVASTVRKNTKALIASDGKLTSVKAKKALELNIPIIQTVEELKELL